MSLNTITDKELSMSDRIYLHSNKNCRYYIIYQITNQLNHKIYIGKHETSDLDDGYMGSGKALLNAIRKYGIGNFSKEILHMLDSREEMDAKEAEIVTPEFVLLETNYNLCPGGRGGFGYINQHGLGGFKNRNHSSKTKEKISEKLKGRAYVGKKRILTEEGRKKIGESTTKRLTGVPKSSAHRDKISKTMQCKILSADNADELRTRMLKARAHKLANPSQDTRIKISLSLKDAYTTGNRKSRDWDIIQVDIDQGMSKTDIMKKHCISRHVIYDGIKAGKLTGL